MAWFRHFFDKDIHQSRHGYNFMQKILLFLHPRKILEYPHSIEISVSY